MATENFNEKIKHVSQGYIHAVQSGDINKILSFYNNAPKFLPPYTDIPAVEKKTNRWSKNYIKQYWENIFTVTGSMFKYIQTKPETNEEGNMVCEIGKYDLRMSNKAEETEEGTYFMLWQKDEDGWKIAVHILQSRSNAKWIKGAFL